MKIFILLIVFLLSFNTVFAGSFFNREKGSSVVPNESQVPIDEEFKTDFVGYDEKEYKEFQKEQKILVKIEKKQTKFEEKKLKLEKKRKSKVENCERCRVYVERLRSFSTPESSAIDENI